MDHDDHGCAIKHHWWCAKETRIPAGHSVPQHVHAYDHMSLLMDGSVVVNADGVETSLTAPTPPILIKAGIRHVVTAITDATWFCVHDADGEFDTRDHSSVDTRVLQ